MLFCILENICRRSWKLSTYFYSFYGEYQADWFKIGFDLPYNTMMGNLILDWIVFQRNTLVYYWLK